MANKKSSQQEPTIVEETKTENISQAHSTRVVEIDRSMVTEQIISSSATEPGEDPRLVKVRIKYPDNYKGDKFFQNGDIKSVSPESAEIFIKAGFATMVESE